MNRLLAFFMFGGILRVVADGERFDAGSDARETQILHKQLQTLCFQFINKRSELCVSRGLPDFLVVKSSS